MLEREVPAGTSSANEFARKWLYAMRAALAIEFFPTLRRSCKSLYTKQGENEHFGSGGPKKETGAQILGGWRALGFFSWRALGFSHVALLRVLLGLELQGVRGG